LKLAAGAAFVKLESAVSGTKPRYWTIGRSIANSDRTLEKPRVIQDEIDSCTVVFLRADRRYLRGCERTFVKSAEVLERSSVQSAVEASAAVDPAVRGSPFVTRGHTCAYYTPSDHCTNFA